MRVAAAALCAIAAATGLALHQAHADETTPFPSPSPGATQAPGSGGYAAIGVAALSANGGNIPAILTSPPPRPFAAAHASSYSVEVVGRLSPSYVAAIDYADANVHGDDSAIATRFDAAVLYEFGASRVAGGVGYASFQRSTVPASSNGFGAGMMLLPNFTRRLSPYGSLFYYPSLPAPEGTHGSLTLLRLGIALSGSGQNGLFERFGVTLQHFGASSTSPMSLTGAEFGIGTSF